MTTTADASTIDARRGASAPARFGSLASVFVGFFALACWLAPWSPASATLLPTGPPGAGIVDSTANVWFLAWMAFAIRHGVNPVVSHLLMSPGSVPLAHIAAIFGLGTVAAPVTWSLGPVAAYNLMLRLAFAGSAFALFAVLRGRVRTSIAIGSGLLFGFGPFAIAQGTTHLDLVFLPALPVIVWLLHELVIVGTSNPRTLGLWLGAACAFQYYVCNELLVLLILVLCLGALPLLGRVRLSSEVWRSIASGLLWSASTFAVLCGYVVFELLFAGPHGLAHPLVELEAYGNDLYTPFLPTIFQWLHTPGLAQHTSQYLAGNLSENGGYLGLPLLGATVWAWRRFRQNRYVRWSLALALIALILSFGVKLLVNARPTSIPLPEKLLTYLPVISSVVAARFSVIVLLLVAVALAFAADTYADHLAFKVGRARLRAQVVAGVVVALVALSLWPQQYRATSTATSPAVSATLSHIPSGAVVLTYPYDLPPAIAPMLWDANQGLRFTLIGGYDGFGQPALPHTFFPDFFYLAQVTNSWSSTSTATLVYRYRKAAEDYLRDNHVTAVMLTPTGADPKVVRDFLDAILGRPTFARRGVDLWLRH